MSDPTDPRVLRLRVDAPTHQRLDAWLASRLPELSRSRIVQLIESGNVRLNGAIPRKRDQPGEGDMVEVEIPAPEPSTLQPEPIPLDISYEDDQLLVVNKPAGLVVHPAPGHGSGTLVNALLHHVSGLPGIGGVQRPGIVHRLDKDTSGLLIVAKTEVAHRALSSALKRREVRRMYQAVAWGHVSSDRFTVDAPIARSPKNRRRMAIVEGGRHATTHFARLERWRAADLLEARLDTGRTHQIRVHLESVGHPVVGDRDYGGGGDRRVSGPDRVWARQLVAMTPRQFLHAAELVFQHPLSGETIRVQAPLPPDLAAAAEWARTTSSG